MTFSVWMSFSDPDRPKGQQFLGVAVVDVTEEEAAAALPSLRALFPKALPGSEVLWVAKERAWALGINPGGNIQPRAAPRETFDALLPGCPRERLMSKLELWARGLIDEREAGLLDERTH